MANGKVSRWEHSRLRQRVSLSSITEDNDAEIGGGGGGARLHPHGGSKTVNTTGYRATEMMAGGRNVNMAVGGAVNPSLANDQPTGLVSGFTSSLYNRNPALVFPGIEGTVPITMPGQVNIKVMHHPPTFLYLDTQDETQIAIELSTTPPGNGVSQAVTTTGSQQSTYDLSHSAGHNSGSASPGSGVSRGANISRGSNTSHGSNISRGSMGSTFLGRGIIPTTIPADSPAMGFNPSLNHMAGTPLSAVGDLTGSDRQTTSIKEQDREFLMDFLRAKASGATLSKTTNQSADQIKIVQPPPGLGFTGPRVLTSHQGQQQTLGHGIPGSLDGASDTRTRPTRTPTFQFTCPTTVPGNNGQHAPTQAHHQPTGQALGSTPANTPANTPTNTPTNTRQLAWNPFRPASRGGPSGMMGNTTINNSQPTLASGSQPGPLNGTPAGRTSIFGGGNHGNNVPAKAAGPVAQTQQPLKGFVLRLKGGDPDFLPPLEFTPVPEEIRLLRSAWLNRLTGTEGMPSYHALLDPANVPFVEAWSLTGRPTTAVVCISNIPYDVTRAEVIAFLGRNARIPNDKFEPVHIVMDRTTSKTNDCYVEFNTLHDAINAVNKHRAAVDSGRHPRIGKRSVELTLSSHGRLMKDLFSFAKGVD
ncbi:hypothetical protein F4776DRAFT_667719 [Hypoxylon sp. NC0597]|nr:hypothetical protein F4776DRAFT_667719 [Hypoxylon sp. NC0597]